MYRNLLAEMVRNNVSRNDLQEFLNLKSASSISYKLENESFLYSEAIKIKKRFFPSLQIEYLFETDSQNKNESEVV